MEHRDEVVSLEYLVEKSFEQKYFIGHTPQIPVKEGCTAWAALSNPRDSGINVYVSVFTANNYGSTPMTCRVWLYTQPVLGAYSPFESVINLSHWPLPQPKARIVYGESAKVPPASGASLFTRVAPADSTISSEDNGKIVLGPGCSLILYLSHLNGGSSDGEFAFGWWEDHKEKPSCDPESDSE